MLNNLFLVYGKEMRELIRDKRTLRRLLVSMLFLPLLMQLVVGFTQRNAEKERNDVLRYSLIGAEQWPDMSELFTSDDKFQLVGGIGIDGLEAAIQEQHLDFAIVVPAQGLNRFNDGRQVSLDFYFHDASNNSALYRRVESKLDRFNAGVTAARLHAIGVSSQRQGDILQPLQLTQHNSASVRERIGNAIGWLLPYLLFIMCLTGAMFAALDIGAGEKERGTLETLLLLPVPRRDLVLGKFLVVFTTAVVYSTLSITGLLVWLSFIGNDVGGVIGQVINSVNPLDLLLVITMLIPVAAIFAAFLLALSCYAKSYKEAASLASFLNILVFLPIIVSIMPGVELTWAWAMVPITNVSLVIKELVKGTMEYSFLIAVFASSAVIALGMIYFCAKWFEKETVLFRE
jgi:sodium transport system permease protein